MRHIFRRTGVWLFVGAVIWYAAGNVAIRITQQHFMDKVLSQRQGEQHVDMNGVTRFRLIALSKTMNFAPISINIEAGTNQATIINKNGSIAFSAKTTDGVLIATLDHQPNTPAFSAEGVQITLPDTVRQFELIDVGQVKTSGDFSTSDAPLTISVTSCSATLNLKAFKAKQLSLLSSCKRAEAKSCCQNETSPDNNPNPSMPANMLKPTINFADDVVINNLDLTMRNGQFNFFSHSQPEQTQLSLGDDVRVSGYMPFFKNAHYVALP